MKADGWNSHSLLWLLTTKLSTLMIWSLMFQTASTRQTESLYWWVFIRSKSIGLLLGAFWDPQSRQIAASPASDDGLLKCCTPKGEFSALQLKKTNSFEYKFSQRLFPEALCGLGQEQLPIIHSFHSGSVLVAGGPAHDFWISSGVLHRPRRVRSILHAW